MNTPERVKERSDKLQDKEYREEVTNKRRQTNLEKYGVDHPMKTQEVQEKQKEVLRKNYGVDNPSQSPEIRERQKQTNLERYGVENVAQHPDILAKMSKTMLERYGVEHYNQLPEMKEYLRENCTDWLADSYAAGGPNKGIARPKEWNQKQSATVCMLIFEGKWFAGPKSTKKGWYESNKCTKNPAFFRSSWELALMMHLDSNNDCISYDYEPFAIPYIDNKGQKKSYIPDFLVRWNNKPPQVIEVKSSYLLGMDTTNKKISEAEKYFDSIGLNFRLFCAKDVNELGYDLTQIILDASVLLLEN